jgi:nucleoside-diphosphate-sugar epimerase
MSENFKFLVTGGAGYIGSILVPSLLEAGHSVTVLDNFMFRQSSLGHVCHLPGLELVRGDSRDAGTLKPLVAAADICIPLAALVGAPLCNRDEIGTVTTNRDAVATMTGLMSEDQRILIPNTNSGYGVGEQGKFCTEESPLNPISLYGSTKVEAEKIALDHGNSISFRLATVFGVAPRMRLDLLVNDFTYRAVNDRSLILFEAHFIRNYIHIRDVAKAFRHGVDNWESMRNEIYNVGLSSANLSKLQLCEKIKEQVPNFEFFEAPIGEDPDKRDYIVSNDKLDATGWTPDHPIDAGIAELIKGFRMIVNSVYGNI